MNIGNFLPGITLGSARYPYPVSHWLQWDEHSKSDEERTIAGIIADNEARIEADGDPIDYQSSPLL